MQLYNKLALIGMIAATAFMLPSCAVHSNDQLQENTQEKSATEPMALKGIMQQLAIDMSEITVAISYDDWEKIAEFADKVGNHPEAPLSEKKRILGFLKGDAAQFKGFDKQVHESSLDMVQAALDNDGSRVISSFSKVQNNCLACHQEFRDRFKTHFYGE